MTSSSGRQGSGSASPLLLLSATLLFAGCENSLATIVQESRITQPSLEEIESNIRGQYDSRAVYSYSDYEALLTCLEDEKFIVVDIGRFSTLENPAKVVVGLRHDVDRHPFKALELARMEKRHGFGVSYYILASSSYAGEFHDGTYTRYSAMGDLYTKLANMGMEIGIHNDLLTTQLTYGMDPFDFNAGELEYYRSLGIDIAGTVAHGSALMNRLSLFNFYVFSDYLDRDPQKRSEVTWEGRTCRLGTRPMADFGFRYEANFVPFNSYFTDSGGKWKHLVPDGEGGYVTTEYTRVSSIVNLLSNSGPGDRIQILTHPVWWGK